MNHRIPTEFSVESPASPPQQEPRPIAATPSEASDWRAQLREAAPMALVLVALVALAIWGHHTGWTMPKFSALIGSGEQQSDDWCQEHDVPESLCVMCQTELFNKPQNYGWCKKHGVHNCPWEHPDVAQVASISKITEADLARAERALKLTERPVNGHGCKRHEQLIQFASQVAFDKLGIGVAPVWTTPTSAPLQEVVTANGEVTYDPTRLARLSSRAAGIVWRVDKKIGEDVQKEEILALIDSVEVGRARTAYVQALVQLDLHSKTLARLQSAGEGIEGKRIIAAEAAFQEARIQWLTAQQALANLGLPLSADELKESRPEKIAERVQFLGLPKSAAQRLALETSSGNLVPITAPFAGKIVSRTVVDRDVIDATKVLFTVADIRAMWLTLDVNAEDAKWVRVEQPVSFRTSGKKDDAAGKVSWISTEADEKTRTVKVRVDLKNSPDQDHPNGRLRANTFGTGRIVLREEKGALVAPNDAIHWEGCCWVVFVQDKNFNKEYAPKVFHVRKVRLGAKDQDNTEIIAGLLKGEMLATKNSGVLRSALLKNSLGAG